MFHKLKQKASLVRVNILGDSSNDNETRPTPPPPRKQRSRTLAPIAERPVPLYQSSDIQPSLNAAAGHVSQVVDLSIELNRMIKLKQDALNRVGRVERRCAEATNRADLLAQQFERSANEVGRLQVELGRKDEAHRLEKQAILQDNLAQIIRNNAVHTEEKNGIQQQLRNIQIQKHAEMREQKDRFTHQVMDIQRRRNEELHNFQSHIQAQDEEIRLLRQNIRELRANKSKPLDNAAAETGDSARASPSVGITRASIRDNAEKDATLNRVCLELETLRQSTRALEIALNRSREEIEERQRAREVLQTELEAKTRALEERTLAWNRTKNELNQEKRKARELMEDKTDKNRQFEFVQQQCARLQEGLSLRGN
ncbi:hypothetical protein BKA65DRAFT_118789 [Rhexocercosporidium sp. MPI-PUGE-AT-0058]|nr:hypothetical protein BKA65DRAFT_118789 [Rhexocercosporidium sp. MPI-PUGE-AT-0058]